MKHPLSLIFLLFSLFLPAAPMQAADDVIEKTYCTQGIAYDSIDDLKLDLLNNAKKAVIDELFGEFIVASTAVENFVVTKDQIQTSSLGFVRVEGNTKFHNGEDFADVCVTIAGYVTAEDRAKFVPEPLDNKYCDADDDMTTAQLIAYVKDETIIQALIEYDPKLNEANKDSLLQLVQKVTYLETGFITDTQTYCATFEGEVIPVEVMAFLETDNLTKEDATTNLYNDEFDQLPLDPKWKWVREDQTHWSFKTSPGYLQILTQQKDLWHTINTAPLLLQPLSTDDFEIVTKIVMAPNENYQQGGLILYGNDDNHFRLTYGYFDRRGFEFSKEINGQFESIILPAPSGDNFYLRISKSGENFSGYYSSDGSEWIIVGKYSDTKIAIAQIGLTAFGSASSTKTSVDFDFFHVTCGTDC